jgi:hypothetical protein
LFDLTHFHLGFLQDRLPAAYEILDCVGGCNDKKMDIFLQRVVAFPGNTFVVLNAEMLGGKLLERLMSFLSHKDSCSSGSCLHCIQREQAILHYAPWVKTREWAGDSLPLDRSSNRDSSVLWTQQVLDERFVERVDILWGPTCGTGKSRHIQDHLVRLSNDLSYQVGVVVLHEGSCISSLVTDLHDNFSWNAERCAVHFSFYYMPDRGDDSCWIETINYFFLLLLVQRSIHDPISRCTFHLGKRRWQIFVELPSSSIVPGGEWLQRFVPILSACGNFCAPNKSFLADKEMHRVCMYLRAFENGTINRKFCSQSK